MCVAKLFWYYSYRILKGNWNTGGGEDIIESNLILIGSLKNIDDKEEQKLLMNQYNGVCYYLSNHETNECFEMIL